DPPEDLEAIVSGGLSQAHVFGDMSVADDGSVYVFWLDTREMNEKDKLASVYLRASHDNGASFADEQRLYLADACPCCQVTTVTGNDDEVYVASRRVNADNIRMPVVSVSRDGGASFAARVAVSGKPWQLDGCPLKPTALAVDGDYFYTLVHNGAIEPAGLLFSRSADAAESFEPAMVVHPDAIVSDFPVLVSHGDRLSAIWHAKTDGPRRLFMRTSTDHGESFGAVREIDTPPGASAYPSAAALPKGDLVVVWQQDEQILATRVKP
ncbi:MAG: hypothetical protein R3288_06695, partial [Woeseiaceae bacterium]|nr:hypothetical protein [Woeseiaceae bacterium]